MKAHDDEITELTELAAEKVSGVGTPANGTPFLVLKAAATPPTSAPIATPTKENTVKSPKSAAAKAIRKSLKAHRKAYALQKSAAAAVGTALEPRLERVKALEKLLKSTPDNIGVQYQLAKELLSAANAHDRLIEAMQRGRVPASQPAAIAAASAGSIANGLGASVNGAPHDPRAALVSVFRDSYRRNSPQDIGQTELPSLREDHEILALEKQLEEAQRSKGPDAMQRVEQLSYQLTRARLIQGHRDGSLRSTV